MFPKTAKCEYVIHAFAFLNIYIYLYDIRIPDNLQLDMAVLKAFQKLSFQPIPL